MSGVAIPERIIDGEPVQVRADDNSHVLIDFGDARFAVVTTGFTIQAYRSPALELYGTDGVLQLLGDDWAPEGHELFRKETGAGSCTPRRTRRGRGRTGCATSSTCIEDDTEPITRPEHALHALEIMLAAQAAGADGRAREIHSDFPEPDLARLGAVGGHERVHDPRSAL